MFQFLNLALLNVRKKWSTRQFGPLWQVGMRQFEMIYPGRREAASSSCMARTPMAAPRA